MDKVASIIPGEWLLFGMVALAIIGAGFMIYAENNSRLK